MGTRRRPKKSIISKSSIHANFHFRDKSFPVYMVHMVHGYGRRIWKGRTMHASLQPFEVRA